MTTFTAITAEDRAEILGDVLDVMAGRQTFALFTDNDMHQAASICAAAHNMDALATVTAERIRRGITY